MAQVKEKIQSVEVKDKQGKKVPGSFSEPEVSKMDEWVQRTFNFTGAAGKYKLKTTFTPSDTTNYNAKSDIEFECDVTGAPEQEIVFENATVNTTYGETVNANTFVNGKEPKGDVSYNSSDEKVATVASDGKVTATGVGTATITVTARGDGSAQLGSAHYDVVVKQKPITVQVTNKSVNYNEIIPALTDFTITSGALVAGDTNSALAVKLSTTAEKGSDVGTYDITGISTSKNYAVTVTKGTLTINKIEHPSKNATLSANIFKGKTENINLPNEVQNLKGASNANATYSASIQSGNLIKSVSVDRQKLTVTANATGTTGTVIVNVKDAKNYNDFSISYTLSASSKTDISDDINFNDKTEVFKTGQKYKLSVPTISKYTEDASKWTYTWREIGAAATRASVGQSTMPEFDRVGQFEVTAIYEDNDYRGTAKATLTIKAATASTITIKASRTSKDDDKNFSDISVSVKNEKDGYARVLIDAKDDLTKHRINGESAYWVGVDITPLTNKSSAKMSDLYVSKNGNAGSWSQLKKNTEIGSYLYIDSVSSNDFRIWFDTGDKDGRNTSLYLATDSSGSNSFEINFDFDAYDDDDDDDKSSSGTNTKKVDGDKVTTTKVNKSPSVKSKKATASFSSSAITDAIDDVKKGYKDDKADKKVIHLDVDTSKSCDETVVTIPTKSVDKIADADASLKIETAQGTFMIDEDALANLADDASGSDIDFCIEEIDDDEFRLYAKSSKKYLTDLGKGEAEIVLSYTLKKNEKAADVRVYRIGDAEDTYLAAPSDAVYGALDVMGAVVSGTVTEMKDAEYKSKKVTFTADDLGTFRITTDVLTTGTTTTPPTNPGTSSTFYDVPMSRWSAPYIYKLANAGIVSGTGGNMFQPTLYVSREEFVKMLAGVAGANVSAYTGSKFSDVPTSRWSAPYIAWAASLGVTNGDTASTFAPTKYITRQEMAAMIYRYVQISGKTLPTRNTAKNFTDSSLISSWATAAVSTMQQAGIIDGNALSTGGYAFEPLTSASREECAKMLAVLYDLI